MLNRFVSYLFLFIVGITSIPFYLIALILRGVTYPFDRRLRLLHLFTCFWASCYTWIMPPWRIRIEGREKVRKNVAYMIVCNHQSQLDILVAFRLFFHYKWVSKLEIFKVPLIGWNMTLNRYIKLKRGDKESIEQMMSDCEERIDEGSSVFFFPEGTRSPDGRVKDFKLGAFQIAKKKKIPILPVVVSGTNKALPKYSMNFHGIQKIFMKVYDEIPYQAFEKLSVEETAAMVRELMIQKLKVLDEYTLGA
ncbi:MAG: 1-acyl-sn-glycerol-3-phosphate acyltransferase [Spirochaetes bacterium]|nr:1-acyl-sn-glycerol-3-phosphate acyltransferase [Spirochaetota bacterium]